MTVYLFANGSLILFTEAELERLTSLALRCASEEDPIGPARELVLFSEGIGAQRATLAVPNHWLWTRPEWINDIDEAFADAGIEMDWIWR
jgi:hypothetical protein